MRTTRIFLILIPLGFLVGMLVLVFGFSREPAYDGMRLGEWVDLIWQPVPKGLSDERAYQIRRFDETPVALRSMGASALPYLLKAIRNETPRWKSKFYSFANGWLARFHSHFAFRGDSNAGLRANAAEYALFMLLDDPDWQKRAALTNAIGKIDPHALEVIAAKYRALGNASVH